LGIKVPRERATAHNLAPDRIEGLRHQDERGESDEDDLEDDDERED
jgi:hypothetical protein